MIEIIYKDKVFIAYYQGAILEYHEDLNQLLLTLSRQSDYLESELKLK